jgi:hypothetical protein
LENKASEALPMNDIVAAPLRSIRRKQALFHTALFEGNQMIGNDGIPAKPALSDAARFPPGNDKGLYVHITPSEENTLFS